MRPIPGRGDFLEAVEEDGVLVDLEADVGTSRVREGSISYSNVGVDMVGIRVGMLSKGGDARVMPMDVSVKVASISVASHDALLWIKVAVRSNGGDAVMEAVGDVLCMELI